MDRKELAERAVMLDAEIRKKKRELDAVKAEILKDCTEEMDTKNLRYVKIFGDTGSVAVVETYKLDVLNIDRLKELVGSGTFRTKVHESTELKYKFNPVLERAIKAAFLGDYVNNISLEQVVDSLLDKEVEDRESKRKLLMKKLKGDYEKDSALVADIFHKDAADFEEELWLVYKIKNWEYIMAFFGENAGYAVKEIRHCVMVDEGTQIKIDYENA